jgi:hypothetical protein
MKTNVKWCRSYSPHLWYPSLSIARILLVFEAFWPGAEVCFQGKTGLALFFSQKICLGLSLRHLVINLSSLEPPVLEAAAGALCRQGAQPAEGRGTVQSGLGFDHQSKTLLLVAPQPRSWLTPLCPCPGPTQCPQPRSP